MPTKYSRVHDNGPSGSDENAVLLLEETATVDRDHQRPSLRLSLVITGALVLYTLAICWITKTAVVRRPHYHPLEAPASSFPHPDEKEYVIAETGKQGDTRLHHLVYDKSSPDVDQAWFDLIKPFNTRVPAQRYEATMSNRSSVRLADGTGDYYVTLTLYHELHCLMRFRWFLDPEYYANKTWEEQAEDRFLMGHYRHCLSSLLESVLCNGDTSMRTFHWDPNKPAPIPDSFAERKCVSWEWLYEWTGNHSFLLQDKLLRHPTFGLLDENLRPAKGAE